VVYSEVQRLVVLAKGVGFYFRACADRDALLESYAEMTPEALDALTPEERRQVYGMLRLKIEVAADGTMKAQGILSENWRPAGSDGLCENGLASLFKSENTKRTELRFSAVLGSGASEVRFERTALS
jgi:hypothetical protein